MTKQENYDRKQGGVVMTEQGDDDRAGGRWQSRETMTEQGGDDRAGGR